MVEVCSFEEDFSPLCSLKIFFAPLNPTVPVPYSGIYQGSESRAQAYVPSHKVFLMMASSSNLSCRPRALRLHSTTIRTSNYSCLTRAISSSQSQSHSQYEQYEQQAAQTRRHQQPTPPPTPQVKDTFRYRLVDPRKHTVGNVRVDVLQTADQHTNTPEFHVHIGVDIFEVSRKKKKDTDINDIFGNMPEKFHHTTN